MRKHLIIILTALFSTLCVGAQDMRTVFVAMPDSLFPLLTKVNREDCIDFLDSKMKAAVTNRVGKTSEMKALTDDYAMAQMTEVSTLEMKLLTVDDSTRVVCVVHTVCAEACDSEVKFYVSDWSRELDADAFLQLPTKESFFLPKDTLTEEDVLARKLAAMCLMKASLSAEDASVSFVLTTPDFLSREDGERLREQLRGEPVRITLNK